MDARLWNAAELGRFDEVSHLIEFANVVEALKTPAQGAAS